MIVVNGSRSGYIKVCGWGRLCVGKDSRTPARGAGKLGANPSRNPNQIFRNTKPRVGENK